MNKAILLLFSCVVLFGQVVTNPPASGAAGGSLGGTYPNPTLANSRLVTTSTDTILAADRGYTVILSNSGGVAETLPAATGVFASPWSTTIICAPPGSSTTACTISSASLMYVAGAVTTPINLLAGSSVNISAVNGAWVVASTPPLPRIRIVTGASDVLLDSDNNQWVVYNSVAAVAVTHACPVAGTSFSNGWTTYLKNANVGTVTVTVPGPCYYDNALPITTIVMPAGQGTIIVSNGMNYYTQKTSGAGTSGGVPYFSDFYTQTSSGVLATGAVLVGGGVAGAPSTLTSDISVVKLSSGVPAAATNVPICTTYTVAYTNAAFIVASGTATVNLVALPAKAIVTGVDVKHSAQFSDGGGAMSQVTVSTGSAGGGATFFTAATNIGEATAVADTTLQATDLFKRYTAASENMTATFLSTGRDFGNGGATFLTGGSVDIGVCWAIKP